MLLEGICRAVVDVAGYRMCWVGRAARDVGKTVRPIARAGHDEGYVDHAEITWADTERGRGPVGTAIRTGAALRSTGRRGLPPVRPLARRGPEARLCLR